MTKEALWKIYCEKNPDFNKSDEVIKLKASGIKKLFEQTWDQAVKQTKTNNHRSRRTDNLMDQMFG